MITPHYYQLDAKKAVFDYFDNGGKGNPLVCMPTGCHAEGSGILMFDGSVKAVENVIVGDLLMGPDSKPRTVISLARGREEMFEIIPLSGESFVVNKGHILNLKTTQEKKITVPGRLVKGFQENITVEEYQASSNWYKHTRKLWRAAVDFAPQPEPYIDAWHFGCLLGDGSFVNSPSLTTMDAEIAAAAYELAEQFGLKVVVYTKPDNRASSYIITGRKGSSNQLSLEFEALGVRDLTSEYKFIPICYKNGSREVRLNVLAGLIDTDGSLSRGSVYDFISKSQELAEDVQFVARSLGLQANVKECRKGCQTGAIGTYYRVCISGDISIVPVRIPRKKAQPRLQKKDCTVTGFDVNPLDEDNFYGFEIDSDHLYLTSDFIVHHNTGKSIVLGDILMDIFKVFPDQRVMMLTHVWKLIQQNASKLQTMWPTAPIGIHSAGLGHRDCMMPIIFGGVQSVARTLAANPKAFGWRDLIFIDEAHLLGSDDDSQYLQVIAALVKINPKLKIVGLTATPYRLKMGLLTDGGLFSDICFNITTHEWFKRLIDEGFLCPLIGKPTTTQIKNLDKIGIVAGEYNAKQAEEIIDTEEVTLSACREILEYGYHRNKCMVFAAGINNAEHIAEMLQYLGATASAVHSKLSADENRKRLAAYSAGDIWAIVGANMLTTGYDEPSIDIIADMQPTMSPGKHVQKLGRGTRVHNGKNNTLVLDFVNNIANNGPIDDPVLPRKPGVKTGDPPPVKICHAIKLKCNEGIETPELWTPGCGAYNHASVRFCCNCANEFSFQNKLESTASNASPMKQQEAPIYQTLPLMAPVYYRKHEGKDKGNGIVSPPTVKAMYPVGIRPINVFLCFEHTGLPRHKSHEWWRMHSPNDPPKTVDEFLQRTGELRIPKAVMVHANLKFPEIIQYEF